MTRITSILLLLLLSTAAHAVSEAQFDAVKAVGNLNGIALNCKYLDETRRMKRSIVSTVPKIRIIGEAFDQSTNDAFLAMIAAKKPCPSEHTLSLQVDRAIEGLEQAFTGHSEKLF